VAGLHYKDSALRQKKLVIPHAKNATWPVEKKIEAVTTYLALGSLRQVAAVTGVSYGMIKQWRIQPWWKDLEAEVLASRRIAQGTKLSKIVDKSLDVIDDRLTAGDFILNNKTGEVQRKPVTLRDATMAANALMQRAAILEKLQQDEKIVETQVSIKDQLANLAAEFAKMTGRSKAAATDIEFKETDNADEGTLGQNDFGAEDSGNSQDQETSTDESGILETNECQILLEDE
jgi:transposase-like protein